MNKDFDFLIVGQGIAGSLLYLALRNRGKTVCVVDAFNPSSASNIAPGIIHPMTGRRIVKTWMADVLIPYAEKTYREIEKQFDQELFFRRNILELIGSTKEWNDWQSKMSDEDLKKYFSNENANDLYNDVLTKTEKKIPITQSGWLNVSKLIQLVRNLLKEEQSIIEDEFRFDELSLAGRTAIFREMEFQKIIFCEGYHAVRNPFWKHLPFLLSKGEVLTIRSEQLKLDHILSKTISILPIGEHLYKVGSTYSWNETDDKPTEAARLSLLKRLDQIIRIPYEVIDLQSAFRPTVKDRRPFIGIHPEESKIGIFNGLGTKGVLLAPHFSNHFVEHMLDQKELNKEVDVKRFS